jgi:hypothetical protein
LEVDDVERVSDLEYLIAVNEPSRCDTLQPNEAVATLWGRGVSAGQPTLAAFGGGDPMRRFPPHAVDC